MASNGTDDLTKYIMYENKSQSMCEYYFTLSCYCVCWKHFNWHKWLPVGDHSELILVYELIINTVSFYVAIMGAIF